MARSSFAILKQYPTLAVFPIISGAILLVVCGLLAASLLPQSGPAYSWIHGIGSRWKANAGPG